MILLRYFGLHSDHPPIDSMVGRKNVAAHKLHRFFLLAMEAIGGWSLTEDPAECEQNCFNKMIFFAYLAAVAIFSIA